MEAERRTRPMWNAIRALALDQHPHPVRGADNARALFQNDKKLLERTLEYINRGAVVPLDTTGTTTGSSFAQTAVIENLSLLGPTSALGQVVVKDGPIKLAFENNAALFVPAITVSSTGLGYIAQGSPIPMRQMITSGVQLDPKKLGAGVGLTRELIRHGTNADVLLPAALHANCGLALDTLFLDATAISSTRPAGIRNGVSATTATALSATVLNALDAMSKDISNITTSVAAVAGTLDNIVIIASPAEAVKLALRTNDSFPFDIYATNGLAGGVVLALAVNALAIAGDLSPTFRISDQSLLHFEDTSPLAISTPGSPATIAAPVRSMWQTDCFGYSLMFNFDWALRSTSAVSWTQSVIW